MIELSTRKWATIKKTAQIVQPNVAKKQRLEAQIANLQNQLAEANAAIAEWDGAIVRMTGYSSEQLIKRVVEPSGKVDANGKPLTITKWVPTELVSFNAENNTYVIADMPVTPDTSADVEPSENAEDTEKPIAFYDIEIFPNLCLVNWKIAGEGNPMVRMINPKPIDIEKLITGYRLIGFNCRRYDNHILFAIMMGYDNEQLYGLSQRIINHDNNAFFGAA